MLFLVLYLIGIPLIGYPLARWSLMVWKKPNDHTILGCFLFPVTTREDKVGSISAFRDGGERDCLGPFLLNEQVHYALTATARNNHVVARYLLASSFSWPLRALWSLTLGFLVIGRRAFIHGTGMLARSDRCCNIN